MTLTCSSAEFLVYSDGLVRAGIRDVRLTDLPAVFESGGRVWLQPRSPKLPASGKGPGVDAAALLAAEFPTVRFVMPEVPADA